MATSREPVRLALRKLWSDHVIWTREYIVAAVAGTPDAGDAATRLLKNQEDIGAAVAGFYGQAAGDRLTELLKEHIMIAVDLVAAAKTGDQSAFATHDARWTANIEAIAAFLAGANPNWPEKDVLDLLALHLKLTKDEAVARITGTGPPMSRRSTTSSPRSWSWPMPSTTGSSRSSPSGSARWRRHDAGRPGGGVARAGDPPDRRPGPGLRGPARHRW